MPPKTKKGKGKATKKRSKEVTVPLDEIDTTILTREKLEEFCINVNEDLIKEKQYAELLRLERDKLSNMVSIAVEQLSTIKQSNRWKDFDQLEAAETQRRNMAAAREQLMQLRSEKNIEKLDVKLETIRMINHEEASHEQRVKQLIADIQSYKTKLIELNKDFIKGKRKLEIEQDEQKSNIRRNDENEHKLIEVKRERLTNKAVNDLALASEVAYSALEKRKNKEIAELKRRNGRYTSDLKHYYNKVVHHNMSVITEMKKSNKEKRAAVAVLEDQVQHLRQEHSGLRRSLTQAQAEEQHLRETLASSKRDRTQLQHTKYELACNNKLRENLTWELEVLEMIWSKQEDAHDKEVRSRKDSLLKETTLAEEVILILECVVAHLELRIAEADATLAVLKGEPTTDHPLDELNNALVSTEERRQRVLQRYHRLLGRHHIHADDTGFQPPGLRDLLAGAAHTRVWVQLGDIVQALAMEG